MSEITRRDALAAGLVAAAGQAPAGEQPAKKKTDRDFVIEALRAG